METLPIIKSMSLNERTFFLPFCSKHDKISHALVSFNNKMLHKTNRLDKLLVNCNYHAPIRPLQYPVDKHSEIKWSKVL